MSTLSKTLLAVLVGILVGGAAYVMAAPSDSNSSSAFSPAAANTGTTGAVDVSGPCDEAEHANDARCAGPQRAEDNDRTAKTKERANPDLVDDVGDDHGYDSSNRGPGSQTSGPGSLNSGRGSSHSDDG